ncbi:MAG TPA: ROK family protein [Rectinemataceae bacterium]|nr:ROK family protein [Rectinemataceae bacterium]
MFQSGDFVVGVDLGGTKILAAAFEIGKKGGIRRASGQVKRKTPAGEGAARLVETIAEAVEALAASMASEAGTGVCRALGVAVPGPLDRAKGIVRYTPNLGLENYPLAAELSRRLSLPVTLENDVQSGVYGELKAGALRGKRQAVGIFVGTGIGGGIVIDGKLYQGSTGSAGEIGHMIVHEGGSLCGCGNYGCLEAQASRTALAKDAIALASAGKAPGMLKAAGVNFRKYRSSAFADSLAAKDAAIAKAVDRAAFWLGVGMANLVNILNPEAIVLGGGVVARFGKKYLDGATAAMKARLMPGLADSVQVFLSELGDLAVPAGAALMALESVAGKEAAESDA